MCCRIDYKKVYSSKECSLLLPNTLSETDLKGIIPHVQAFSLLNLETHM